MPIEHGGFLSELKGYFLKPQSWCSVEPAGQKGLKPRFHPGLFNFSFSGLHVWHVEVPRLGVESELQLLAYTTVTSDPSHTDNLHCSSQQRQILNPLREAGDQMASSWMLVGFISPEPQWELPPS